MNQFAPLDTPVAIDAFLGYWRPTAIMLMESEIWPNLIMAAAKDGILLGLLNARFSVESFKRWSLPVALPLISLLLSKFTLIAPLSNEQAIRFQILEAPPFVVNFSGDLKYVVEGSSISEEKMSSMEQLQEQLFSRKVWMASSLHRGEERMMIRVHKVLKEIYPDVLTIMVPRNPHQGQEIAAELHKQGINTAQRSHNEKIFPGTNIYIVDTIGELRDFYRLTPIAVIGGSFIPGSAGHNISEAASAGCAILTGFYIGHFCHMARDMQRLNPLSVLQVSGDKKLADALIGLFGDSELLEAHRMASKQAYLALSRDVLENIWSTVELFILDKAVPGIDRKMVLV